MSRGELSKQFSPSPYPAQLHSGGDAAFQRARQLQCYRVSAAEVQLVACMACLAHNCRVASPGKSRRPVPRFRCTIGGHDMCSCSLFAFCLSWGWMIFRHARVILGWQDATGFHPAIATPILRFRLGPAHDSACMKAGPSYSGPVD